MNEFKVVNAFTARSVDLEGYEVEIRMNCGDLVYQRSDGRFEHHVFMTRSVTPPQVDIRTYVFDLDPETLARDLKPT